MCGLIGRIGGARSGDARALATGLPWLARRGPDSQNEWRSKDGAVELLHVRLAIVDKTAVAHQPLHSAAYGIAVAFVGEVYNHAELRRELSDYQFATNADTEVLLALYARFGAEGLSRATGMIACAIVDEPRKRVVLFRDAVGKKPLFLARWRGQTLFGSSLIPLIAASGGGEKISDAAAAQYWLQEFMGPANTAFDHATPVMPGEVITLDFSGREISRARAAPRVRLETCVADVDEVVEGSFSLIRKAVRRRLENNPSPAVLLSGGLDSTVIAIAMKLEAEALGLKVNAITLGAILPFLNDEPHARYAAERIGLPLTVVSPASLFRAGGEIADDVVHAFSCQDEPLGMLSYFSRFQLIARVRRNSQIVMTGDGGDEIFLGYDQTSRWLAAPHETAVANMSGPALPTWMSEWGALQNSVNLLGHNFAVLDRASAEQGVEARCPLLDWDVMAYARQLSPECLLSGGRSKALFLRMLADWPKRFLYRKKIGFAHNLRWIWARSRFAGLREMITVAGQDRFSALLPEPFTRPANAWSTRDIFNHFPAAWKLAAWSDFERKVTAAAASPAGRI